MKIDIFVVKFAMEMLLNALLPFFINYHIEDVCLILKHDQKQGFWSKKLESKSKCSSNLGCIEDSTTLHY